MHPMLTRQEFWWPWLLILGMVAFYGCSGGGETDTTETPSMVQPVTPTPVHDPVPSTVQVWQLDGQMGGGTLSGTITTDAAQSPYAVDAHGLAPNSLYHLVDWDVTLSPNVVEPAALHFTPDASTEELCLGTCIFDPRSLLRLWMTDTRRTIQLVFEPPTSADVPQTAIAWGQPILNATTVRATNEDGTFAYLLVFQSLTLTAQPLQQEKQ